MLIARAPVRISFFGGGTDLSAYYLRHGGAVLSTSIDKYVYVILNVRDDDTLQITSSDYRTFYRLPRGEQLLWEGDLSLPRAVLHHFGVAGGVSIFLASEVPPGTGLGSSSSVTVALCKAVSTASGQTLGKAELAALACRIEIDKLGRPIGVQDQYASAFGGLNWISFSADGIQARPVELPESTLTRLERGLLLMFTGSSHDSANILSHQRQSSANNETRVIDSLQATQALAHEALGVLQRGELERFGGLLDTAWQLKRNFAPGVTNAAIDEAYRIARNNGALGGKITGAGGGGFLMLYCEEEALPRVEMALTRQGLKRMDFRFDSDGARVLFNAGLRLQRGMAEPGSGGK